MAVDDPPHGRNERRPRGWRRVTLRGLSARRWWRESAFFGYLLNSPALLLLVLLEAYPIVQAVWTSFQHHNLMRPTFRGFAGLENYATIADKPEFWTALYVALVFASTERAKTIPVVVAELATDVDIRYTLMTSAGVIAIVPPLVLAFVFQRMIVSGLLAGSVKG